MQLSAGLAVFSRKSWLASGISCFRKSLGYSGSSGSSWTRVERALRGDCALLCCRCSAAVLSAAISAHCSEACGAMTFDMSPVAWSETAALWQLSTAWAANQDY